MKREWTIYKILSPNNRVYIGITSNYRKRCNYYKNNDSKGQKKLSASFSKYGFDSHNFEIIDTLIGNISEALSKEMFWIRAYMSNCIKYPEMRGLNLTDGGQGTIGYKATDELRKRLSDYHKANPSRGMLGKKCSPESIAKRLATIAKRKRLNPTIKNKITKDKEVIKTRKPYPKKTAPAWNKGLPMLPHVKEALMLANKNNPPKRVVNNYSSLTKEERYNKFGKHNVGNTYNIGRKHSPEVIEARAANLRGKSNTALYKKVVRYNKRGELIGVYKSIKEGAAKSGYSEWTIGNICKGLRKTESRSFFKYAS